MSKMSKDERYALEFFGFIIFLILAALITR